MSEAGRVDCDHEWGELIAPIQEAQCLKCGEYTDERYRMKQSPAPEGTGLAPHRRSNAGGNNMKDIMTRLTLPWSVLCSVNQRTNPIAGRQYLTKRYRKALENATIVVMAQVQGKRPKYPDGRVGVSFDFYPPDKRRRDVGNFTKLPEDAMTGIVYTDDSQIVRTTIQERPIDRDDPRVEITVEEAA